MEQRQQVRILEQMLQHLDNGTNVDAGGIRRNPISAYTCPDLAAKEWQTFYREHPQIIGMSADLPAPGTFLTTSDFGTPVLATRSKDGVFRAFVNVCRHRGVLLEPRAQGQRSNFACPFHAWTYSNTGDLISVPKEDHFGRIDKSCHGLVPLPAVERYGILWVGPRPGLEFDVDALLGGLAPEFSTWDWEALVNTGYDHYEGRLNWKLAVDSFGETYHFKALHKNTIALSFHPNMQTFDRFGRNHRMGLVSRTIEELRSKPTEDWDITQHSVLLYYLFPNIQLNVTPFGVVLVRTYPDVKDPARSTTRIGFYSRSELLEEQREQVLGISQAFADVIWKEDFATLLRSQIGADAGIPESVVFGRNEPALHSIHNNFRDALGLQPLGMTAD